MQIFSHVETLRYKGFNLIVARCHVARATSSIVLVPFIICENHLGRKIRTKLIRDGKEVQIVGQDDDFDFNFQVGYYILIIKILSDYHVQ